MKLLVDIAFDDSPAGAVLHDQVVAAFSALITTLATGGLPNLTAGHWPRESILTDDGELLVDVEVIEA